MIIILGVLRDRVLTAFSGYLAQNQVEFRFVDMDELAKSIFFYQDHMKIFGEGIRYDDISGVYNRIVSVAPEQEELVSKKYYQQLEYLNYLLDYKLPNVINPPSAASSNNSKLYQLKCALEVGFKIPLSQVLANHDSIGFSNTSIYKSVGGIRSIVRQFTQDDENREITCPVLFQDYIAGANIRVHLVNDVAYSLKITSASTDYRYTESPAKYEQISLPAIPTELCRKVAKNLRLPFVGIDLIQQNNEYYFLEANTSPAYNHFEEYLSDKPISAALQQALTQGVTQ